MLDVRPVDGKNAFMTDKPATNSTEEAIALVDVLLDHFTASGTFGFWWRLFKSNFLPTLYPRVAVRTPPHPTASRD